MSSRWSVPDWASVAADHDGVPLSVAGWDPDETWWLNDVLHQDGEPRLWSRDARDSPLGSADRTGWC